MGWDTLIQRITYDPQRPLLFSSLDFLIFFVAFLGGYVLLINRGRSQRLRNIYVILFSVYFYYKSSGFYFFLIVISTLIDFFLGRWMHQTQSGSQRRCLLILSLVSNLGMLAYFKYTNFLIDIFNGLVDAPLDPLDLFLPVGISFYTFQTMSYTIDIYRRKLVPTRDFWEFAFFVSFFPQLVAGPIVRASYFLPQLKRRIYLSQQDFGRAIYLICGGLFKKAVISDYISINFVDRVFENPALYSGLENLLAVYGYALQIYCDFSGYSDMAIGLALLLGFHLPENFRSPYQSQSLREFWRRWHISLSTWLRDYLYISMGGNRKGKVRTYIHVFLTMLLGGLWHGAAWKFIIWGALHGLGLVAERALEALTVRGARKQNRSESRVIRGLKILLTFHIVCFCWIFFRAADLATVSQILLQISSFFQLSLIGQILTGYYPVWLLMLGGYVLHFVPRRQELLFIKTFSSAPFWLKPVSLAGIIWLVWKTHSAELQPFIYFQF